MRDVPRNAHGWPTIPPSHFTLPQLIREARKWQGGNPGTVGGEQWDLYTNELLNRGFSTKVEIQERILPDEVTRRQQPSWWHQMKED